MKFFAITATGKTLALLSLIAGLICAALAGVSPAFATDVKAVTVTASDLAPTLKFAFEPTKSTFKANEPITFNTASNQSIFLYVYSKDSDGNYILILPNRIQKHNKYPANQTMQVPNKSVHFIADGSSSIESVYAVASTRYIDIDLAAHKKAGDFSIVEEQEMKSIFSSKGINLRDLDGGTTRTEVSVATETEQPTENTANTTITITESTESETTTTRRREVIESQIVRVDLRIDLPENTQASNASIASAPAASTDSVKEEPVIAFVSTDKQEYSAGDTVHILMGASAAGNLALYLIGPENDGADEPVKNVAIDANKPYRFSATHSGATGEHRLRVVYSADDGGVAKALTLDEDNNDAVSSVTSIMINQH